MISFTEQRDLEVYYGNTPFREQATALATALKASSVNGKLLIGYPVIGDGGEPRIDAVLNSPTHGVVLFLFRPMAERDQEISDEQDSAVFLAEGFLQRFQLLRRGRRLAVPVNAITLTAATPKCDLPTVAAVDDGERIRGIIESFDPLTPHMYGALLPRFKLLRR